MIDYEEKEKIALLLSAADSLGHAVRLVEEMALRDIETVRAEEAAADQVVIEGPEVIRSLRSLSRRCVR